MHHFLQGTWDTQTRNLTNIKSKKQTNKKPENHTAKGK